MVLTFPVTGTWSTPVYAVSKAGVLPSVQVTWFRAQQACALAGKRLLTNAEWQLAAAGTQTLYEPGPDNGTTDCNVATAAATTTTGSRSSCVSNWSVNDMVGNVSEWVADWIQGPDGDGVLGAWNPHARYPATNTTATHGFDLVTGINEANPAADAFPAALTRGGNWNEGNSAGVFALNATVAPSSASGFVGFRCAR